MTPNARLARLTHPGVVVGAIVVLGTLLSWRHTRHVHEWLVMPDELLYVKLAQSLGDGSFPLTLRGQGTALLSQLYPLIIAPVLSGFSAPEGYQLVHLLNALLFASTAVPAYLLAREVGAGRLPSYLAAALAVAVPWTATSGAVMTEAVAYPAFAWALLALQRAVVAPSLGRDAVALAAIGLAFFARTQFILLAAVLVAVIVAHEVMFALTPGEWRAGRASWRTLLDRVRPHAALGAVAALALLLLVLPGTPLKNVLGPYQRTLVEGTLLPAGSLHAMRVQLIYVGGGLTMIPLVLAGGWSLATMLRPVDRRSHAYAALTLVTTCALTYTVAVFGLRHSSGPLDRYLFYITPLLAIATVLLLTQGRGRPFGLAAGALLTFWLLRSSGVRFVPDPTLLANSQASEFNRVLEGQANRIGSAVGIDELTQVALLSWGMLASAAVTALLLHRAPRFALALVGLPLLGFMVAQADYVARIRTDRINVDQGAINSVPYSHRDWIDEALPGGGDVALATSVLADPATDARVWWNVEFWNKRVNRALIIDRWTDNTAFPQRRMSLDERTGVIRTSDGSEPRYLVFGRNQRLFRPRGRLLAEYKSTISLDPGLELVEATRPYRAQWIARGLSTDGWISRGTPGRLRVFPREDARAQRVTLNLDLPIGLVPPSPFTVRSGSRVVRRLAAAGTTRGNEAVTLCLPPGRTREVSISTRASRPLPDRRVGVHLYSIRVVPADRSCRSGQLERPPPPARRAE